MVKTAEAQVEEPQLWTRPKNKAEILAHPKRPVFLSKGVSIMARWKSLAMLLLRHKLRPSKGQMRQRRCPTSNTPPNVSFISYAEKDRTQ